MPSIDDRVHTLEDRVDELANRQTQLEQITERIRRDQRETRRQIRDLRGLVENVPATVQRQLDSQTGQIKTIVAESETRNADRITGLARQWPAGAIILATSLAAIVTAVAAGIILAATGHLHL